MGNGKRIDIVIVTDIENIIHPISIRSKSIWDKNLAMGSGGISSSISFT